MHLPGHNFTGPGTKLNKRLNPDLTPKKWSKPLNRVHQGKNGTWSCIIFNRNKSKIWMGT